MRELDCMVQDDMRMLGTRDAAAKFKVYIPSFKQQRMHDS